jgi:hypothetical protein
MPGPSGDSQSTGNERGQRDRGVNGDTRDSEPGEAPGHCRVNRGPVPQHRARHRDTDTVG